MTHNVPHNREDRVQRQLDSLRSNMSPDQLNQLIVAVNSMRDAILSTAERIAANDPDQLQRYLDSIASTAQMVEVISFHNRPVDKSITKLRQAIMDIGFGKFVNPRTGKQESPED